MKKLLSILIVPAFLASSAFALDTTTPAVIAPSVVVAPTQKTPVINEKTLKTELLKLKRTGTIIKKDVKNDLSKTKRQNIKSKQKKQAIAKRKTKTTKQTAKKVVTPTTSKIVK